MNAYEKLGLMLLILGVSSGTSSLAAGGPAELIFFSFLISLIGIFVFMFGGDAGADPK